MLTIRKNKIHAAGLSYRLMSRINGGLCIPIELPGSAATAQILEQLSQLGQFQITAEAKQEICQQVKVPVRNSADLIVSKLSHFTCCIELGSAGRPVA